MIYGRYNELVHGDYNGYQLITGGPILYSGGDWNHGILNDFPIILGMSSSQLTNSCFSER